MFPQGGPGVALLLLRISVAATLLVGWAHRPDLPFRYLLFMGALLIALSLSIGFLTPFLSVIVGVAATANLLMGFNSNCLTENLNETDSLPHLKI